ncbi:hypothetical protein GQ55_5G369800 [Panicum hallii var. hallii]|uniref:Uncharacterized protein n=1 Tax=Panicum hallii var. hallii TaxID=1504633 RepID=A0A2T7DML4_9POAL|nr:hypothetical protein GQ55_5G369800 [Panicum hallii var. hallii]
MLCSRALNIILLLVWYKSNKVFFTGCCVRLFASYPCIGIHMIWFTSETVIGICLPQMAKV